MDVIKLALLNKLDREIEETKEINEALNATDEILIHYNGSVYLDYEILEYARKYYANKLDKLKKEFEEA